MAKKKEEKIRDWRTILPGIFKYKDAGELSGIPREAVDLLARAEALSVTGDTGTRDERFIASLVVVLINEINVRDGCYGVLGLKAPMSLKPIPEDKDQKRHVWDKRQIDALVESILQWRRIASIPSQTAERPLNIFKEGICMELDIEVIDGYAGCPLCREFHRKDCRGCPIAIANGGCVDGSPFGTYQRLYNLEIYHSQSAAHAFYQYLVELLKTGLRSK